MKGMFLVFICGLLAMTGQAADDIEKVSLPLAPDMYRADLYVWQGVKNPQTVLVLSPGYNGNGEGLIRQSQWQEFARINSLGLVGLSFASDPKLFHENRGYYYASKGSGKVLLNGIRKIYKKDLPLLLYGFSGGAHFTSRFVEWKPERVITWCAYSAAWWDEPQKTESMPLGIVACGDQDTRYGASLMYFKQGRAVGKPWLWVSLSGIGHNQSNALDGFVRKYFSAVLHNEPDGLWVDVDRRIEITATQAHQIPSVSGWIPTKNILADWIGIHK